MRYALALRRPFFQVQHLEKQCFHEHRQSSFSSQLFQLILKKTHAPLLSFFLLIVALGILDNENDCIKPEPVVRGYLACKRPKYLHRKVEERLGWLEIDMP